MLKASSAGGGNPAHLLPCQVAEIGTATAWPPAVIHGGAYSAEGLRVRYILLLACGHWHRVWLGTEPADGDPHDCMRDGLTVPAVYLPDRALDALVAPVQMGEAST